MPNRVWVPGAEEGPALGGCRDRPAVVFDPEQQRQVPSLRLRTGLQELALLRGAVAHAADHQRLARLRVHGFRHTHCLQGIVPHRRDHPQQVQLRVVEERTHVASLGGRTAAAEQVIEEPSRRHSPGQQHRPGAVMAMQPIVRNQVIHQYCRTLVAAARDLEIRFPAIGDLVLDLVDTPRQEHRAVESEKLLRMHDFVRQFSPGSQAGAICTEFEAARKCQSS